MHVYPNYYFKNSSLYKKHFLPLKYKKTFFSEYKNDKLII